MFEYPSIAFKTNHVSLGISFVHFLSSDKKIKRVVVFVTVISEWHGVVIVALFSTTLSNTNVNMLLWTFFVGDSTFAYYIFNPKISIH